MGARYLKYEEAIIRNEYPTASRARLLALLPDRTWEQIGVHARKMGVHRTSETWGNSIREGRKILKDTWSDRDNKRFDHLYPNATRALLLDAFPARTWISIQSHAQKRQMHRRREAISLQISIGRGQELNNES